MTTLRIMARPHQIAVRLTDEQRARWEERSSEDKRTLADWIRIVVDEHCDELDKRDAESKEK